MPPVSASVAVRLMLALVGAILLIVLFSQTSSIGPSFKSFSAIYDLTVMQNVDLPFEAENLTFNPNNTARLNSGMHVDHHSLGLELPPSSAGEAQDDVDRSIAATPVPEVVMNPTDVDQITMQARKNIHPVHSSRSCNWQEMSALAIFNASSGTWSYKDQRGGGDYEGGGEPGGGARNASTAFCGGRTFGVTFPITGEQLLRHFNGKRIVFMGDSVARNSFVLTMARLCNSENYDKCITRTPTMEFDVVNPPNNRGPMGCVPNETDMHVKSLCYEQGKFANIPLRGLTLRSVPQDRNGRRNFIRKGLIGPVMGMMFGNVSLLYHPVTKPNQLTRTGLWMRQHPNSLLHADVIIVSIGPHLRLPEVQATPETLIQGLTALRAATSAPIVAAEFVHALASSPQYISFVDGLMETLRKKMDAIDVTMVPQRFITQHGFMLSSGKVVKSEAPGTTQRGCGYYDPQHPALRCQMTTSDMLLGAGMIQMLQHQQHDGKVDR